MFFPRVRRKAPASLLILFCVVSRPVHSQEARECLRHPSATTSSTNRTWRPVSFSRKGLTISNRDGTSEVRFHGYIDADGRLFATNLKDQQHNVLLFRHVRPLVEGTLANSVDFTFMPDFGEGKVAIEDVYAEWKPSSIARPSESGSFGSASRCASM